MQTVPVQEALGMVLRHDVTRIVPGKFKGRALKKGHIINEEDIPVLLNMGKEHVYAFDLKPGYVHEDEAAARIARAASGNGIIFTEPSEGRVNLKAGIFGLLKVNAGALQQVNEVEEIVFATMHTNQSVNRKQAIAGTRIVPLVTGEDKIKKVEDLCSEHYPVIEVKPFKHYTVGVVTTGSEVFHGRIEDEFGPVVQNKFAELGSSVINQVFVSDDVDMTVGAIMDSVHGGAELVVVTGGMSVDPDDQTPASIRATGGKVITYGAPTFPGAMFMLAYLADIPIVGLPGCVMYYKASIFDLIVPRILAGETLTRSDITALGHGGFCASCPTCRYPVCGFGKGN
ncbi:MAG: molybdopterin-binding protein [Thermodesulfobacteriota bacterium]|nr:molybdopterin-binding protein [Thermodesulfobacteriota bacterium]